MPDRCEPCGINVWPGRVLSVFRTVSRNRSSFATSLAGRRTACRAPRRPEGSVAESAGSIDDPSDQLSRIDAVGEGGEVEHEPVTERRHGDAIDVVVGEVDASVEQRQHLGAEKQCLAAARTRTET